MLFIILKTRLNLADTLKANNSDIFQAAREIVKLGLRGRCLEMCTQARVVNEQLENAREVNEQLDNAR